MYGLEIVGNEEDSYHRGREECLKYILYNYQILIKHCLT